MKVEIKFPLKYAVSLLLVVIVIIVPVAYLLNEGINNFVLNGFRSSVEQYNSILEKSIYNIQMAIENDIMTFATNDLIQSADQTITSYKNVTEPRSLMTPSKNGGIETEIYNLFEQYGINHPNVIFIYLATKYGGYVCWPESPVLANYDPTTRPWYKAAYEDPDSIVMTAPYKMNVTGDLNISNVKAIYDQSGEPLGVIGIDLASAGLTSALTELKEIKDRHFMMIHQTGLIVMDSKYKSNELKTIEEIDNKNFKKLFYQKGMAEITIDKERYVVYSEALLNEKWHLLTFAKKETLFSQSYGVIQTLLFGSMAILLAIVLLIVGGGYLFFWNQSLQGLVKNRTQELQIMIDGLIEKEQSIRESEERYRALVENMPGVVYRCLPGKPWKMIHISNEVFNMTGYTTEEFLNPEGLTWENVTHPEDIEILSDSIEDSVNGYYQMVYRILSKEGQIKWVYERGRNVVDANGNAFLDGVIFDYTDRMMAEKELQLLSEELEERVEKRTQELKSAMTQLVEQEKMASLGGIVSGVAHEVNTPLGISVTLASYINKMTHENIKIFNEGTLTKSHLMSYFDNMVESVSLLEGNLLRAADLISSFKQISVNQSIDEMTLFKPNEYIQLVITSLKHEYKNTKHQIVVNCPETFEVFSYAGAYSQIFTNFIMNSLIHGLKNVNEGVMTIDITKSQDHYRIVYSDNGSGISKENLNKIFEAFFTTNRQNGGSGLGLHIVYKLVTQKLEGTIVCNSQLGQGVQFVLDLPLHLGKTADNSFSED